MAVNLMDNYNTDISICIFLFSNYLDNQQTQVLIKRQTEYHYACTSFTSL